MWNWLKVIIIFFITHNVCAQKDSSQKVVSVSGYAELYYAYDFSEPHNHKLPVFLYSFNRHNEVNLNLGFIKMNYLNNKTRANFALMAGTYANANLAQEPGVLKNIFEANAGVNIFPSKNIWIDAGVFPSHIGVESAVGKDNWTLTRSIVADNSPYYESGIKISHTSKNEKWFFSVLILNGWQRIQRLDGNNTPAVGHQITYKPKSEILINSSSFIGSNTPDSTRQWRYYHNFYTQFPLTNNFKITAGFDIGMQQKSKSSNTYCVWYSPILFLKYTVSEKLSITGRGEMYNDPNQVIIQTHTPNGFQTYGYSINSDYHIQKNVLWRIEIKLFSSKDKIFLINNKPTAQNYFLTTSLCIGF